MLTKIDWISFSFKALMMGTRSHSDVSVTLKRYLELEFPGITDMLALGSWAMSDKGRKPYSHTYEAPMHGIKIFYSDKLPHAVMEISGQGCDWFQEHGQLETLMQMTQHRMTRIDVASDIYTPTDPIEFADQRQPGRFKSAGQQISESGTTVYIGSRTSDRYCKVYRYNPPHERSPFLRIEYTFKGHGAKLAAHDVLQHGAEAVSVACGVDYGWQHIAYQPDRSNPVELAKYRPERPTGKTIFWLADTIAPLLVRMHQEGQIDVYRWMEDNVISKLPDAGSD